MFGLLKKMFEKKPAETSRQPFYDIVCPYCFSKFHHEDVVFRAAHYRDDDELFNLQEDPELNDYRKKFGLAEIDEIEAIVYPSTIPDENKIYSNGVLMGVSDKYAVV